jgi:hypothetical protein
MPNRLCQRKGQAKNQFVRGPCAVAPYDRKKYTAICIKGKSNLFTDRSIVTNLLRQKKQITVSHELSNAMMEATAVTTTRDAALEAVVYFLARMVA